MPTPTPEYARNLRVVLVSPRNPLNIGAAARAMSNFGFLDLRVVNPYDVAFREARSAVNAGELMRRAEVFTNVADAVADCHVVVGTTALGGRHPEQPLRRLEYGGRLLRRHLPKTRVALLFGSEKFGLSNDDIGYCHWLIRIPTRPVHQSMNLGQSVAVCLYELIRTTGGKLRPEPVKLAPAVEIDRATGLLMEALREAGFVKEQVSASSELKIRRMVRRLNVSGKDAVVLQGMLRQILWRMKQK